MEIEKLFNLAGKTAVVTGCSRGIGEAMAVALAKAGANIIGVSGTLKKGSQTELKVKKAGTEFYAYAANFSNRDAIYNFVKEVNSDHPVIDILINNAGTILRKPAADHPDEYWDRVLSINLDAGFILAREFGRKMLERGYGKIVFTCSLLTFQGGINVPGYTASKSAVGGLVKALSNEWASRGVHVNGIAPGYIVTKNTEALVQDEKRNIAILNRIPAGRWGKPEDFEGPVIFLSSAASDYVDGTILTVDGGWMAR